MSSIVGVRVYSTRLPSSQINLWAQLQSRSSWMVSRMMVRCSTFQNRVTSLSASSLYPPARKISAERVRIGSRQISSPCGEFRKTAGKEKPFGRFGGTRGAHELSRSSKDATFPRPSPTSRRRCAQGSTAPLERCGSETVEASSRFSHQHVVVMNL